MLQNKNIVIIGGTTGLGLSAAQAFLQQGARVVAVGPDPATNQQAQETLGTSALVLGGDATQENTAVQAIDQCRSTWGSLDGLYHVAGGSGRRMGDGPLHEMSLEGWQQTLDLNLTSVMLSNRAAIRAFLEAGLVDELLLYVAPVMLGERARPLFEGLHIDAMTERLKMQIIETRRIGDDVRVLLQPQP